MIIDFKICTLGSGLEATFWSFGVRLAIRVRIKIFAPLTERLYFLLILGTLKSALSTHTWAPKWP